MSQKGEDSSVLGELLDTLHKTLAHQQAQITALRAAVSALAGTHHAPNDFRHMYTALINVSIDVDPEPLSQQTIRDHAESVLGFVLKQPQ